MQAAGSLNVPPHTHTMYLQLSAKRFVNVRTFNGKVLVDIREYYTDDSGERKPGRKGRYQWGVGEGSQGGKVGTDSGEGGKVGTDSGEGGKVSTDSGGST